MRNKKIHQGGENAASWMNIWSVEERKGTKWKPGEKQNWWGAVKQFYQM